MIRILLDTNAYVAFKRGDKDAVEVLRHADKIGISVIVLGELLAGFATGNREAHNRVELDSFLDSPRVEVISVDPETTRYYASIYNAPLRFVDSLFLPTLCLNNVFSYFSVPYLILINWKIF